jgi:hypothetical protein
MTLVSDGIWTDSIYIELGKLEDYRVVRSAGEAQSILLYHWPVRGGEAFRHALEVCAGVLNGERPVEEARYAFMLATEEAGLYAAWAPPRQRYSLSRKG